MDNRPNPNDTEEEILRQQQNFLKQQQKPSVQIVKSDELLSKITNATIEENATKITPDLIGNIVENHFPEPSPACKSTARFSSGFPQAKRRKETGETRKGSIFSQQNKKLKNLPGSSFILSGQGSSEIHLENVQTLNKMSENEILEEQNKLLNSMDPNLIQFLKSKRQNIPMETEPETIEDMTIEGIETPKEIIESADNWVNFDSIEIEKLQWMKNIEIPKKIDTENYEARFDFKGWLLPFSEPDISEKSRILYHHGDESGRPGYTLNELFKLCRSNVHQQRILSLNTISNILFLSSTGIYENTIEIPIEQIFFVIRISVDDNTPTILNSSLRALRNLFFNQMDENSLDFVQNFGLGIIQPELSVKNDENDKELNDQQLCEIDLVGCLIRTDILTRFRYIINSVKPNTESIVYCIEILTRLMRDSQKNSFQIYNFEGLFSSIIRYFVPKIYKLENMTENCYGKPLYQAIKLLRISSCRSKTIAENLVKKYQIFDPLLSYVSNQIGQNANGIKIQIESFRLLTIFFRYKLGLEHFSELTPFLMSALEYHFHNTHANDSNLILSHFSAILNIISAVSTIDYTLISNFIPLLIQCTTKFCTLTSNLSDFKCTNLQIISSLLITMTNITKYSPVQNDDYLENLVFSVVSSNGFNKITENILNGSNLLSQFDTYKVGPNLKTVESGIWSSLDHIVPCINSKSCLPFLVNLSYFIENSRNKIILKFLQHSNIIKYLNQLKNCSKYNLTSNWFTKIEAKLILNILKSSFKAQNNLPNLFLFYEITVRCLSIFTVEEKLEIDFLLKNIVFNKNFYPNEVLMTEMSITENRNEIFNILSYLDEIYICYSNVLGLKQNHPNLETNLTIDVKIGNIIPLDWSFSPIVSLYSQFEDSSMKKTDEIRQTLVVTRCLQWIFLYETYFPDLSSFINATDRFCRLSCIFLCSNTLFLESNVHNLLELCLKVLVAPENFEKLDFNQDIQGLNNFQDFYVQLLEQYQGVSYGNKLFANFILIPLAQKHNVKWRKILWSEYLGVAQTIILDVNQCVIDIKQFLEPAETDVSLLKCYRRALLNGQLNRSPFLKLVAGFHVDNYVKHLNQPAEKLA